jgi:hypothetical protein
MASSRNIYSTLDNNIKTVKKSKGNANDHHKGLLENIALKLNYSTEKHRLDGSVIENRVSYPEGFEVLPMHKATLKPITIISQNIQDFGSNNNSKENMMVDKGYQPSPAHNLRHYQEKPILFSMAKTPGAPNGIDND